jgi:WD40 repeat protein
VWGGVIRYREAHSLVRYPSEVDDEFITPHGYGLPPASPDSGVISPGDVTIFSRQPVSWLRGWNFTTDLYRILEHVVDGNRRRFSSANGTSQVWSLFTPAFMSEPAVMERVLSMYAALPPQFKETPPTTGDMAKDLFGFQSANIQATLQLLRMLLLSAEELGVDRKCDVAGELLSVFSNVPLEYLNAISSPLVCPPSSFYPPNPNLTHHSQLHHLGGIGYILGSVMEGSLSEASYQRVRTLL